MLLKLSIRHFALIDHIEWDCSEGWTVLTGETGSGKSILLGALGLVLGDRAEGIRSIQQEKCIVEAEFRPSDAVRTMLGNLDEGGDCIIRRSIAPGGKSRAYINDEPVKLQFLKTLAPMLVDLHGQQDGQRLHASEGLLHAVDSFSAEASAAAALWRERFDGWRATESALDLLRSQGALPEADVDYLRFQIEELEQVARQDLTGEVQSRRHFPTVGNKLIQGLAADGHDERPAWCNRRHLETGNFGSSCPHMLQSGDSLVVVLESRLGGLHGGVVIPILLGVVSALSLLGHGPPPRSGCTVSLCRLCGVARSPDAAHV